MEYMTLHIHSIISVEPEPPSNVVRLRINDEKGSQRENETDKIERWERKLMTITLREENGEAQMNCKNKVQTSDEKWRTKV